MNKTVKVVAHIEVDPNHIDFVLEVQREAVQYTLKENGCIEYTLYRNIDNPNKLTFVEMWETMDDLEAHLKTDYFVKKGQRLEGMIVGKDVHVLESV